MACGLPSSVRPDRIFCRLVAMSLLPQDPPILHRFKCDAGTILAEGEN